MADKVYQIPVMWTLTGTYYVRASSLEAAKDIAYDAPLPKNGEYLDESFELDDPDENITEWDEAELRETGFLNSDDAIIDKRT